MVWGNTGEFYIIQAGRDEQFSPYLIEQGDGVFPILAIAIIIVRHKWMIGNLQYTQGGSKCH